MSEIQKIDQMLFYLFNTVSTNSYFDAFFPAITDLHKTWEFRFIFMPLVLLLLLFFYKLRGFLIFTGLGLSQGLGDKIGSLGKHFWQRPRPFEVSGLEVIQRSAAGGYSFPSNHALNMFCVAFFLSSFFPRYRWLFFLAALLVALSRVYNGVHFPLDVIAGAILGSAVGVLGSEMTLKIIRRTENYLENRKKSRHV